MKFICKSVFLFLLVNSYFVFGEEEDSSEDEVIYELCSEIKCGIDAQRIESKVNSKECTCICPDDAKGDPFHKCDVIKCGTVPGKFRGQFVFSVRDDVTATNHWPWMVSLGFFDEEEPPKWNHKCGASIVSKKHVLTAAHCAAMIDKELWNIIIGISDFNKVDDHDDYIRKITDVYIHDRFELKDKNSSYFDVAVLTLDEPINYSDDPDNPVGPICLPKVPNSDIDQLAGTTAALTGWGATAEGKTEPSQELITAVVTVYSQSHCDELHENSELLFGPLIRSVIPDKFQSNIMCAGNPETGESACHGDSGGPLVQFQGSKVNSNHYLQIGVVQGGIKCGDPYFPSIFSNLGDEAVLEFILNKSGLMTGSFEKSEEIIGKCLVEGECLNSALLGRRTDEDESACLQFCQGTNGCTWITYDKEQKLCLAHSECALLSKGNCKSCISSHVSCRN